MISALPLPTLSALTLSGLGQPQPLLTERQRLRLASFAKRRQLPAKTIIYRAGDPAASHFINASGVVMSFKEMPSGKRRVAGFRFHGDLFGLAEHGRYVNTTRAITPVTIFEIPVVELTAVLRQDAELQFQFFCKVVHDLRQAQRKLIIVARRDAAGRVAMFVDMMRSSRATQDRSQAMIADLPMTRSEIGDYLNLSLESVSRACRRLSDSGILAFDKGQVRILDRARFDHLVARN